MLNKAGWILGLACAGLVPLAQADNCVPFDGYFLAQFDTDIPGPPYPPTYAVHCPSSHLSPARQCTHGKLYPDAAHTTDADILATYEFGFDTQTADPATGTVPFTGTSVITLAATGAVIHANDHGYLKPDPNADGQAASFETQVAPYDICESGRCKSLKTAADSPGNPWDASYIIAGPGGSGSLNVVSNTSSGDFIGQICKP